MVEPSVLPAASGGSPDGSCDRLGLCFSAKQPVIQIKIPDAVPGEAEQQRRPTYAHKYPLLSDAKYGMLLHLPVLADLVGSSADAQTGLKVMEPENM